MAENLSFQILTLDSGGTHAAGPFVRICGRTEGGESVAVTVHDIKPYFWVKLRDGLLNVGGSPNKPRIDAFVSNLNDYLNQSVFKDNKYNIFYSGFSRQHTLVELDCVEKKYDYYGYSASPHYYMKLKFGSARALTAARYALLAPFGDQAKKKKQAFSKDFLKLLYPDDAMKIEDFFRSKTMKGGLSRFAFILAEANIAHENQLMADMYIQPGEWIEIISLMPPSEKKTNCNLEFEYRAVYGELNERIVKKENAKQSPIKIFSWDLEVFCEPIGNSGVMKFYDGDDPDAKILCVSAVSFDYGSSDMTSVVFSLSESDGEEMSTATDGKTQVLLKWYTDESTMLRAFFKYIKKLDPDVITGYNTERFDWLYLIQRCSRLNLLAEFDKLARWGKPTFHHDEKDAWNIIDIPGRIVHDMLLWLKKNRQYREYKLQYVCEINGLDGKDDVKYSDIAGLFQSHEGRIKLAIYCELDSRLVCRLIQLKSLDPIGKTVGLSCITGVPSNDLLFRGSMHTLRCCLLRYAHRDNYVLSCPSYSDNKEPVAGDDDEGDGAVKFEGGKVLNPIRGFYSNPVVTLDFSSLYPSCMQELNICPSTSTNRQHAKEFGLPYTQPPAPSLEGFWYLNGVRVARCKESNEKTELLDVGINFYTYGIKKSVVAQYSNELNETIVFKDGRTADLSDGGYVLTFQDGVTWTRADKDILVFVDTSIKEGTVPKIERNLKLDRKKAKRGIADAESRGDDATAAFFDNLQNAIKVVMNALYG